MAHVEGASLFGSTISSRTTPNNGFQRYYEERYMPNSPKEDKKMRKYYKVLKATPAFDEGAILTNQGQQGSPYSVVDPIYLTEAAEEADSEQYEIADIVEVAEDWFQRVYPVAQGGTKPTLYLPKEEAKKAKEQRA